MRTELIRSYLYPDQEKRDQGLRNELQALAHLGLRLLGGLEAAVPLVMLAAGIGVIPIAATNFEALAPNLAVAGIGALTLLLSTLEWSRRHARLLAAISVWFTSATFVSAVLILRPDIGWVDHYLMGNVTLVQFGAAALPFRPMQTFALGLCIDVFYAMLYTYVQRNGGIEQGFGPAQHLFTLAVTLACTALAAIVYRQRAINYETHQRALRTSEDLRRTQSKLLISENAAVMGRLAAALSHELNSPIGVLASAIDTLSAAAQKDGTSSDAQRERVRQVVLETHRAGRQSAERLRSIVARMQRFTNLDRAEVQSVQMNDLIADVIALVAPESRKSVSIEFHPAERLPRFAGRPQQLSAVFSNLIGNALNAVPEGGRVSIATRGSDSNIEITVADNGAGLSAEDIETAFNPAAFKVSGQRIAAGNWSLFSCRQIIEEHGGDVTIRSTPGEGTTVSVSLPL